MTRSIILPIACATLVACATGGEPRVAAAGEQRCWTEPPIGSSIRATRCHDPVKAEQDKRDTDLIVDQIRRARTQPGVGTTGSD